MCSENENDTTNERRRASEKKFSVERRKMRKAARLIS